MRYLVLFLFFIFQLNLFPQAFEYKNPIVTISISAVGDLMCHAEQFDDAELGNGKFDFDPSFQHIKKYLINSDFTVGNLETVTAGKYRGFSTYPLFNTPSEYITALKNSGFNLLFTANNHAMDQGKTGVLRTITQLNKNNINYTGTFKSKSDRDSIRIFNIKGIKIAFLAYAYGINGNSIPKNGTYLVNIISSSLIKNDIKKARKNGAEIVFVYFHFGDEYSSRPTYFQKEIVKKTINAGADIIIGSHPHVVQPIQYFKTKNAKLDTGIIAYSLGNFFTGQRHRFTRTGIIFNIKLSKNFGNDSIYISNVSFAPTFVLKHNVDNIEDLKKGLLGRSFGKKEFLILSSEEAINSPYSFLTKNDLFEIRQSISDSKRILTRYTSKIELYDYRKDILQQLKELAYPISLERPKIFWEISHEKACIYSLVYFSK